MARQLRIGFADAVYNITNRVNAKQDIFIDNTVQKALLEVLAQIVERFKLALSRLLPAGQALSFVK